jgi:hypothetical protein
VLPGLVGVLKFGFLFDGRDGLEEELADIGESGGVARGDAILGQGGEDFAEDVIDVGGVEEIAGEGSGQFGADALGFEKLLLFAGVERAEPGMREVAKHAATAAVGIREMAQIVIIGVGTLDGHGETSDVKEFEKPK